MANTIDRIKVAEEERLISPHASNVPIQDVGTWKPKNTQSAIEQLHTELGNKQSTLVNGESIKSINGRSLLGEGNIEIKEEHLIEKTYTPSDFSGLGRKYLQKNIVSDKNVLTQAMMQDANTIYVIQYDYDLNGQSITVPSGCVLQFEGGSLSNGKLISQATKFENMSGALNSIVLSEALENFNEIILDENYSCTFEGFHKISLGTDISISGVHDFILWKDETLFDFYLNGNGHKIMINDRVRFISDKSSFSNVQIISSVVGVQFGFYAKLLDARSGGANVHCVNCSFTNLFINGSYNTLNYNNCTFSNCRQIYGYDNLPNVGGCERNFIGCKFVAGTLNQTSNYAFVQVSFNGWDGKTLFDGCYFADNIGMGTDWIDTYDGCNITISNCHFYSSKRISGEGLINIKSHSEGNVPQSGWLDTLGSKYNAIVTGCTFTIDLAETDTSPYSSPSIIQYNSMARSASTVDDDFYLRYGALISNNVFTFRGTSRGANLSQGGSVYPIINSHQGCKNLMITDNVINAEFVSNDQVNYPYVSYILFKLTNEVDTVFYKSRMENCIIQNNVVFGNSSSVVYMFSPIGFTQKLINMKTNDPTNYAKICPKHNIFRDNIIWSGSSGTYAGRNYVLNTILDGDNILQGNLLHIADNGNYYSSAVNINRTTGVSYVPARGDMIFNTNVGKPMWWKGAKWVYADGTDV